MPNQEYALTMARYNLWQNENLLNAASGLSNDERQKGRGAFFGSIERTFSHLLWADMMWLHRFIGTPAPEYGFDASDDMITDWDEFVRLRTKMDETILTWARDLKAEQIDGDLSWYSGALGRDIIKPWKIVITHLFNHQIHHRGQIHAMLTSAGAKPQATDILVMPDAYPNR